MFKLLETISLVLFLSSLLYTAVFSIGPRADSTEIKTCFNGYVLYTDGTCVREINQNPVSVCPEGSSGMQGCRVEVPFIIRCPSGYTKSDDKCFYRAKIEPSFFCPLDFTDSGEDCLKITPSETVARCEIGELIESDCVLIERQAPIVNTRCPTDAIFEGNVCWRVIEEFLCTEQLPNPSTFNDIGQSQISENTWFRSMGAPKKRMHEAVVPVATDGELVAVSKPHVSLIKLVKQVCQRRVQVDPYVETYCPTGFTVDGSNCVQQRIFPPQPICATTGGNPTEGGCPPVVYRTPKIARCPDGIPVIANQCDVLMLAAPEFFCPTEFKSNGASCEGYLPAPSECAPGLQMIDGRCVGKLIRPALTFRISTNFKAAEESVTPSSKQQRAAEEKKESRKRLIGHKKKE